MTRGGKPRTRVALLALAAALLALVVGCGSSVSALDLTTLLPPGYRGACAKLASRAPPRARACPPLIPAGRLEVELAVRSDYRDGYIVSLISPSIGTLGQEMIDANGGHWTYEVDWSAAVERRTIRHQVERPVNARESSSCRRTRVAGRSMEACQVVPYEQGGGFYGGHIAYVWKHDHAAYVISLHGYSNEPRARAMMAALVAKVLE